MSLNILRIFQHVQHHKKPFNHVFFQLPASKFFWLGLACLVFPVSISSTYCWWFTTWIPGMMVLTKPEYSRRIHVWYIYLHLPWKSCKIYHIMHPFGMGFPATNLTTGELILPDFGLPSTGFRKTHNFFQPKKKSPQDATLRQEVYRYYGTFTRISPIPLRAVWQRDIFPPGNNTSRSEIRPKHQPGSHLKSLVETGDLRTLSKKTNRSKKTLNKMEGRKNRWVLRGGLRGVFFGSLQ